ncbi:inosine-uridine preferring nucleoside hydrolase-like protein [Coleophoma crateriformis]|uniref:Inosine-uridine preferring nucleoside hydrolase-like protein n=1 Tax=Coleophoma crateriformis TaxID=565419 RepID=A0A3D8R357_9HELO|nr:inosine-uridine preferring nucleoside hydrolase-like protein [Coleophoma crateriformis]
MVIMDNDWGSITFIPFLLALKADWKVLGLTSCTCNSWEHQQSLHALATLALGNLTSCVPIIQGATFPLLNTYQRFQAWEMVHGALPYEGVFRPYNATREALGSDPTAGDDPWRIIPEAFIEGFPSAALINALHSNPANAASFMVEQVRKYPGQVSIYVAGAMTNVALAVRMDPQFASLAKELVIMGGYLDINLFQVRGSLQQADDNSDINLMIDPEAAKITLTAAWPSIKIAGNVANQVINSQAFVDEVYQVKNPYSTVFYNNYGTYFPFWDETAAALMVDPSIILNSTTLYVDVDTSYGSPSYGNLHAYQKALMPTGVRNVTYIHQIDGERLHGMIKAAVQYPASC